MASDVHEISREVESLRKELTTLQNLQKSHSELVSSKKRDLSDRVSALAAKVGDIHSLDDVMGRRIPKWYEVDIPFEFGDSEEKFASVEISDGPFICNQLQPLYFITDTDASHFPLVTGTPGDFPNGSFGVTNAAGRMYPCSAFYPTWVQMAHYASLSSSQPVESDFANIADIFSSYVNVLGWLQRGRGWNYPEFDFSIQIQGSGRYWTDTHVPACAFYGANNPLYLGFEGIVDKNDRVVIGAKPTIPTINTTGIVRFILSGYEIDTDLTISDILGY
jgi:hypothetical protein